MMSLAGEIAQTYRAPGAVVRSRLGGSQREDRALLVLMLACGLVFVAQWPRLAREAYLTDRPLEILLGGALLAWIFVAPLLLYALAALSILVLRAAGRAPRPFAVRFALFWALLAAAPLWLVHGLVAGLIGPGPALTVIGAVALAAFFWFWWSGLRAACGSVH